MAVQHEGERVLRALQPADRVVLLDERGRDVSSEDLARLLAQVGGPACRSARGAALPAGGSPPTARMCLVVAAGRCAPVVFAFILTIA